MLLSIRRNWPALLAILVVLTSIPLVAGFLGALHPAFDAMAHFRLHLAAFMTLLAVPLLFARGWRQIGLVALALSTGAAATAGLALSGSRSAAEPPETGPARFRLMQINLRFDNPTPKAVFSAIGHTRPDVITLNEVSQMWAAELAFLKATYPYRIVCSRPARIGGVAILSRRPFLHPSAKSCTADGEAAVATVNFGGAMIDIAALHLEWPWPFGQHAQVERLAPVLEGLAGSAILAGDLNAAPWSVTARNIAHMGALQPVGGIGPTWFKPWAPEWFRRVAGLPIDHVMTKGRVVPLSVQRLQSVGSDHLPVLMEFGIVPKAGEDGLQVVRAVQPSRLDL